MNVIILFGAGASSFSGECMPESPPLGNRLFDDLVLLGPPASELEENYGHYFRDNFEIGMREVFKSYSDIAVPLLRQMGKYLGGFELGQNNTYCRLIRLLAPHLENICLATLNYDCLLEQALSLEGVGFSLKPFCTDSTGPYLMKLHGSSNWLPVLDPKVKLKNVCTTNPYGTFVSGLTIPSYFSSSQAVLVA